LKSEIVDDNHVSFVKKTP